MSQHEKKYPEPTFHQDQLPFPSPEGWVDVEGDAVVPDDTHTQSSDKPFFSEADVHYGMTRADTSATQAPDTLNTATDSTESEPSVAEKLMIVHNVLGFYPVNSFELSEALSLIDQQSQYGKDGTIRHLQKIRIHQEKSKSERPERAVIKIVRDYIYLAQQARTDLTFLHAFTDEVTDPVSHPSAPLADVVFTDKGQFVRAIDVRNYVDGADADSDFVLTVPPNNIRSFNPYSSTRPKPALRQHIDTTLNSLTLDVVRKLAPLFEQEQHNRYIFWTERLHEARRYLLVSSIVREALTQLGYTQE